MAIIRAAHERDFTIITNAALRDTNLSLKAKGALSFWQMLLWNRLSTTTSACFTASTSKANTTLKPGMTSWSLSSFSAPSAFRSLPRSTVVR